jgi:hypothetical protein
MEALNSKTVKCDYNWKNSKYETTFTHLTDTAGCRNGNGPVACERPGRYTSKWRYNQMV